MTNVITLPSFDSHAKSILKGWKTFDKAQDKLSAVVCTTMQKFVDTWSIQVGKDEKAVKAPFSLISYLTKPYVNLNLTLN